MQVRKRFVSLRCTKQHNMVSIELNLELLLTLHSKSQWISRIPRHLPEKLYHNEEFLWVDSQGNKMVIGEDFSAAEELNSYPVYVYRHVRAKHQLINNKQNEK